MTTQSVSNRLECVYFEEDSPQNIGFFESVMRTVCLNSHKERIFALMTFSDPYEFASHLDESFDMKGKGLFTVGGLIVRGAAIFDLDNKLKKFLKDNDIEYFKASECERGKGPFRKYVKVEGSPSPEEKKVLENISGEFIGIIPTQDGVMAHGITVDQDEFYDVIKDPAAKAVLRESPYRLAYDLAMIQCAWMMKALQTDLSQTLPYGIEIETPHVSFVCDEHEEHSALATTSYLELKRHNPLAEKYMASCAYMDEKKVPVLQAADAVVYIIRRATKTEMGFWPGDLPSGFKILAEKHRMGLIQHVKKVNLENIVKLHKPGESYKLNDIMEQVFHKDIAFKTYPTHEKTS